MLKFVAWSILRLLLKDWPLSERVTVNFGVSKIHRPQEKETSLFVDGSLWDDHAGIGVWCRKGHRLNFSGKVTGRADNNRAELAAVYWALLHYPRDRTLTILTDSRYVLNLINGVVHPEKAPSTSGSRHARQREGSRVCKSANERLLNHIRLLLQLRSGRTHFQKIPAHKGHKGPS